MIKTTLFAGGRGSETLIRSMLAYNTTVNQEEQFDLTVLINCFDDGISTRICRRIFHIPGPSDLRKNLVTLLDPDHPHSETITNVLEFRLGTVDDPDTEKTSRLLAEFAAGRKVSLAQGGVMWAAVAALPEELFTLFSGGVKEWLDRVPRDQVYINFSLGNIILSGLTGISGDIEKTAGLLCDALPVCGRVVPATAADAYLYGIRRAEFSGQRRENNPRKKVEILDEAGIVSRRSSTRISTLYFLPGPIDEIIDAIDEEYIKGRAVDSVTAAVKAIRILQDSDLIIYGPGTQYSSIIPTLLVSGIKETIANNTTAKKIWIANIRPDEDSPNATAYDLFSDFLHHAVFMPGVGYRNLVRYCLVNTPSVDTQSIRILPDLAKFQREPDAAVLFPGADPELFVRSEVGLKVMADFFEAADGRHKGRALLDGILVIMRKSSTTEQELQNRLTKGAITFDVDETLLRVFADPLKKKKEYQPLVDSRGADILIGLLERGFRLCAITGNDTHRIHERLTAPLFELLGPERRHLMQQIELYGDGASTHWSFGLEGGIIEDVAYSAGCGIEANDMAILEQVLLEEAQNALVALDYHEFSSLYNLTEWPHVFRNGSWYLDDAADAQKLPWIEVRGKGTMLTVKPLPSARHLRDKNGDDMRLLVHRNVMERLRNELGAAMDKYSIEIAGWSSIDVTRREISKATAMRHFIQRHGLTKEDVLFFGNEIRPLGNDAPLLDVAGVIVSVNQPEPEVQGYHQVVSGGERGVESTWHHLNDILEIHDRSRVASRLIDVRKVVPAIRQKMLALLDDKIRQRKKVLSGLPEDHSAQQRARISTIRALDTALLSARRYPVIIPAAGKGSQFNGVPKALHSIKGRLVIERLMEQLDLFASGFYIATNSENEEAFRSALVGRDKAHVLLLNSVYTGEGKAVLDVLKQLYTESPDVIVCWSDLVICPPRRVRQAIEHHASHDCSLTLPVMAEAEPYAAILKDVHGNPSTVAFRAERPLPFGEHDCSIFIADRCHLQSALQQMHDAHVKGNGTYSTPSGELKFLEVIARLYAGGHRIAAEPFCRAGEFQGFNTLEEAAAIEAEL